jgi:hypothetical protein
VSGARRRRTGMMVLGRWRGCEMVVDWDGVGEVAVWDWWGGWVCRVFRGEIRKCWWWR